MKYVWSEDGWSGRERQWRATFGRARILMGLPVQSDTTPYLSVGFRRATPGEVAGPDSG